MIRLVLYGLVAKNVEMCKMRVKTIFYVKNLAKYLANLHCAKVQIWPDVF
jgi:hypothetical protein